MDQSSTGCLVPKSLTNGLSVNLSSDRDITDTFKAIEQCYWNYLDNYRDYDRKLYPTMPMLQFSMKVMQSKGMFVSKQDTQNYIRIYNRHKKNIPTAGVILYHRANDNIYFVVVRMRYAKIWSMPKGKKEPDENLVSAAKREFLEETGIELEDHLINADTPHIFINKTRFYIVESDDMNTRFDGFNSKEIDEVKWTSAHFVVRNATHNSKQTVLVAKHLLQKK